MLYNKIFERCTEISGISEEHVCPSVCTSLKHSTNVDDNVQYRFYGELYFGFLLFLSNTELWQYCLLITARSLYMFRTLFAPIIRSIKNCSYSHWCMSWIGMMYIQ